ncbi:hypothetical protein ACLQ7P_22775 (plasmid) [Bacillus subtilis subsp. subtilis]
MATHGEDINDIFDNLIQMIYSRLKRKAIEDLRKQKLEKDLNLSKPIQTDLTKNLKDKIKNQSRENNLKDYRKLERAILEYDLKLKSGYKPSKDEKDEYLLNNFKRDIYATELNLSHKDQIEIRQDILESINDKDINNDELRNETMNNHQEIEDLINQEKVLNSDLAREILSEIQQNQSLMSSVSDSVKNEASNNISVLNKSYNDLSKGITKGNIKTAVNNTENIRNVVSDISSKTDKTQSKENEIERIDLDMEHELER